MPENNFERRVQQKMEEFKLPPSDLVWLEVERRIRKEKRRRFIFWWFLLAILLAGGIGTRVWLGNKNEKKPGSATENITLHTTNTNTSAGDQPISRIRETKADTAMTNTITRANNQEPKPGIQEPVLPKDKTGINTPAVLKKEKQKKAVRSTAAVQPGNAMLAVDHGAGTIKKKKGEADTKVSAVPVGIAGTTDTVMAIAKNVKPKPVATAIADTVIVNSPVLKDTTAIQLLAAYRKDTSSIDSSISITAPLVSIKKGKWKWEIILSGGRSSIVNGFGKFKQASFADVAGGGGTAVPPPLQVSQSDMRSGLSWGIQVNRKKAISGKLDLSIGLGYAYYSTRMEVGARVDSVRNLLNAGGNNVNVNNYFRVSGSSGRSVYTNQFHFAGLSAELSWKIINRKKFSMYWRNGLQYNHLVGSTMLHYDYNLPGLYKDNSLLKKGQLFYTTGLSVPVGRLLHLNPYFNYGLTIVLNAGESRTHYNSAGLRFIFSLPKK